MAIKTFTANSVLTAADTTTYLTNSGPTYSASTTFAGSPGVELSGCFTSTYDNYEVVATYYGSAAVADSFQMMTGTNTIDNSATYNRYGYYYLGGVSGLDATAQTGFFICNHGTTAANYSTARATIYRPNISGVRTEMNHQAYAGDSNLTVYLNSLTAATTAYTGMVFVPASGTLTGTITIYGWRKP
jgi:hypothetical protein